MIYTVQYMFFWGHVSPRQSQELTSELEGSFTGGQLHLKLGPHAAFSRLVRVLSFQLVSLHLEPLTFEQMLTKSGHSRDGAVHTFNKHAVVVELVTHGLLEMQDYVSVAMHQVKVIYLGVLQQVHKSLRQFFPLVAHHEPFHRMLDAKYEELLQAKLEVGTQAIQDRIKTKTKYLSVDLPNRILTLLGLTPMIPDVLHTNPRSAYYEENKSQVAGGVQEFPAVVRQRQSLLAMKQRLYEQQQDLPFHLIDFVEGGQQDLHQDEYRSINVDAINRAAEQYFTIIKALLCLDIEDILNYEVFQMVENREILLRSMREEMLQLVANFQPDEVYEIIGTSFETIKEEQIQTNMTLKKLKGALVNLEAAVVGDRLDLPPWNLFCFSPHCLARRHWRGLHGQPRPMW